MRNLAVPFLIYSKKYLFFIVCDDIENFIAKKPSILNSLILRHKLKSI